MFWGLILTVAISVWLKVSGTPSPAFCWLAWAILGQASGAYVGPKCWAVMFLAAAAAVLHERPTASANNVADQRRFLVPQTRA